MMRLLFLTFLFACHGLSSQDEESTSLTLDPYGNLLVISTLDGTLTAVDRLSGNIAWVSHDKPMVLVPDTLTGNTKAPYFLPDPKTGALYVMGKENSLRKLPFTIPQLVAMAPCKNSEGIMYTGKKSDMWLELNPLTGEKSEMSGEGTCPAYDSCESPKRKSLIIGKTEYMISMIDGARKWNITYHHYVSKDMTSDTTLDYDLVHFTSPSQGSLTTYNRVTGELLWSRELSTPVMRLYGIDATSNLVSLPFNVISSNALNRLKSPKPLSPTTYVGEFEHGLYAIAAYADDSTLMIEGSLNLIEGPSRSDSDYILFGYYKTTPDSSLLIEHSPTTVPSTPQITPTQPPRSKNEFPPPRRRKEEIKIVFTTALISIFITSLVLGTCFFFYRRRKVIELNTLSSDSTHSVSGTFRRDSVMLNKITYKPGEILGKGCEGTFVYKGTFEGRDVAVKRILPECFAFADTEVDLLKESDNHEHVIRYFCTETDGQFRYIALELCIATLYDYVEGRYVNDNVCSRKVLFQATDGLNYLHSLNIVHRDVKPANVLLNVGAHGVVKAMISDFGLCKKIQAGRMSFSRRSGGIPGTDGWIAPELIKQIDQDRVVRMTYSVDIFSMGCVYYYVLTNGQHPFGDTFHRQSNILTGSYDLSRLAPDTHGAHQLVLKMIDSTPSKRPNLNAVLKHPLFWSREKTLRFFLDVSDRIEKESDQDVIVRKLECITPMVFTTDWRDSICEHVANDLRKYRTYKGHSVRDLLRALRNKKNHYRELTQEAQLSLGSIPNEFTNYWVSRFPHLLFNVWAVFAELSHEIVFEPYYSSPFPFTLHFDLTTIDPVVMVPEAKPFWKPSKSTNVKYRWKKRTIDTNWRE